MTNNQTLIFQSSLSSQWNVPMKYSPDSLIYSQIRESGRKIGRGNPLATQGALKNKGFEYC